MNLELKRKQLELARVQMARSELEFRIEEKMEEIKRIQDNIKIQQNREKELLKEIDSFKK